MLLLLLMMMMMMLLLLLIVSHLCSGRGLPLFPFSTS
jgi:hypothetical protein